LAVVVIGLAMGNLGLALLASAVPAALLTGLIHLLIVLIVLAIVYYLFVWILGAVGAPPMIAKLVLILCAVIALYFVAVFLFSLAP
jgi:hypothetical protein